MALSQVQYLNYNSPWGTAYHKGRLFCVVGAKIYGHTVALDGSLTKTCEISLPSTGTYLAADYNYLYVQYGSSVRAVSFDEGAEVLALEGTAFTNSQIMTSSDAGFVYAYYHINKTLYKLSFNGSTFDTLAAKVFSFASAFPCFGIDCGATYVVIAIHDANRVYFLNVSDLSEVDTVTLQRPDGVDITGTVAGITDNYKLSVYNVSGISSVSLIDDISLSFPLFIADNLHYDGQGNYHIFRNTDILHVYFDGTGQLVEGSSLSLTGGSGRLLWQMSTYVSAVDCFYGTKQTNGLFVISRGIEGTSPIFGRGCGVELGVEGTISAGLGSALELSVGDTTFAAGVGSGIELGVEVD